MQSWCHQGKIVFSNGWRAYESLSEPGFEHDIVGHDNNYVDSITGVHTNNLEAFEKGVNDPSNEYKEQVESH